MGDWYRGDCHVHSVHSDGELTPAELAAAARAAGLDFLAVTEHNCAAPHETWAALGGEDLLILLGQEVTTRTGHWLALGLRPGQLVDWRHRVGEQAFRRALREVRAAGGLSVAAHPHAPYPGGDLMFPLEAFDAVEVWNGAWASDRPWNADNAAAHAEWGRRLAAGVRSGQWQPALGNRTPTWRASSAPRRPWCSPRSSAPRRSSRRFARDAAGSPNPLPCSWSSPPRRTAARPGSASTWPPPAVPSSCAWSWPASPTRRCASTPNAGRPRGRRAGAFRRPRPASSGWRSGTRTGGRRR
ncbi:CehA/McbA family metallohydrolase [Kitasatospora griseola]|uniref:CehA/McbA family metallohydrolase n=1 Tax=Kitasatospora griseola TaxID=2064 RepID=UPI003813D01F